MRTVLPNWPPLLRLIHYCYYFYYSSIIWLQCLFAYPCSLYMYYKLLHSEWFIQRWRNGLARLRQWPCYLQGPGFESRLRPVKFFSCNKVFHSPVKPRRQHLCRVPHQSSLKLSGTHIKQQKNYNRSVNALSIVKKKWKTVQSC